MYTQDQTTGDIIISGFEKGIGDSPYAGISDMRNLNITSVPGEASVNFSTSSITLGLVSGSVASADSGTEIITFTGLTGSLANGQALVFTGASLPAGISAATVYWARNVSGVTCKLSTKPDLSDTLNITGTGTGTVASTNMGKPLHKTYDNDLKNYYIIDASGRVWGTGATLGSNFVYMGNTTLTNANGNGIIYYLGYLFVFRNDKIDYMNTTSYGWTYGWQTLNTTSSTNNTHFAHFGQDNTIYYCDGYYLGSFYKKNNGPPDTVVFDPSSGATYTFNSQALKIPLYDIAQCLAELGTSLLVGGQFNAIYPWDRLSTSFSYPILLGENYITRMVTVNTNTYIFAGSRGNIYLTNGSQARIYKKIPDHLSGTVEPYFQWGDANYLKNQLFFGVSCKDNAGTAIAQYGGLWAIDMDTKALRLVNQLSFATYAGLATVILPIYMAPSATTAGTGLYLGWDSGASTYGMDGTVSAPYIAGQAYFTSDMIPLGTLYKPKTPKQIEFKLSTPLLATETIELQVASYFGQSFTPLGTITGSASSTILSGNLPYISPTGTTTQGLQWVLIKVILTGKASSPSYNRLTEIRII